MKTEASAQGIQGFCVFSLGLILHKKQTVKEFSVVTDVAGSTSLRRHLGWGGAVLNLLLSEEETFEAISG